jgi:Zn-dependent peptidase ImmA (M78 family)
MDLGDLKRFDSLKGKYDNFQTIVIKSEESDNRVSGTNTRAALIGGDKPRFQAYLPSELSDEEKEEIWTILQKTPIEEIVTQPELDDVERIADEWFEDYGIDIVFTKHFIERVNDERNGKPISAEELEDLFTQTAEKYGEKLANLPDDYQAVLLKLRNDINLPFALNYDDNDDEMDLVAKTVMRKKNFQTSNPKLALEEMYAEPSKFSYPPMIKSLTEYMLDKGMNIRPLPKVKFVNDDTENAQNFFGKTAYYNPNNRVIVLYTMNRHPKDVMRSYAHEMVHHMQNCDGRLRGITTQNTNEGGDLPEIEREAYEKGNMTFRNWTDTLTEGVLKEETENDILAYKSTFKPDTNILVVFKENENYENLEPLFDKYGYGFYYPQDKTIIIDGEVFVNSSLDFNDLKFVEAHEVTHLLLGHTGPYSKDDEMDADLGAYILLKNKGLSTDKLVKEFKNRHGVDFDEKLLERVKDML